MQKSNPYKDDHTINGHSFLVVPFQRIAEPLVWF
jgi:hypothetical protein